MQTYEFEASSNGTQRPSAVPRQEDRRLSDKIRRRHGNWGADEEIIDQASGQSTASQDLNGTVHSSTTGPQSRRHAHAGNAGEALSRQSSARSDAVYGEPGFAQVSVGDRLRDMESMLSRREARLQHDAAVRHAAEDRHARAHDRRLQRELADLDQQHRRDVGRANGRGPSYDRHADSDAHEGHGAEVFQRPTNRTPRYDWAEDAWSPQGSPASARHAKARAARSQHQAGYTVDERRAPSTRERTHSDSTHPRRTYEMATDVDLGGVQRSRSSRELYDSSSVLDPARGSRLKGRRAQQDGRRTPTRQGPHAAWAGAGSSGGSSLSSESQAKTRESSQSMKESELKKKLADLDAIGKRTQQLLKRLQKRLDDLLNDDTSSTEGRASLAGRLREHLGVLSRQHDEQGKELLACEGRLQVLLSSVRHPSDRLNRLEDALRGLNFGHTERTSQLALAEMSVDAALQMLNELGVGV